MTDTFFPGRRYITRNRVNEEVTRHITCGFMNKVLPVHTHYPGAEENFPAVRIFGLPPRENG